MLKGVERVLLRVPSLAAGIGFYRDKLGLSLLREDGQLAVFDLGSSELVLHASEDLPAMGVYFRAEGIEAAHATRDELRLKFAAPPRKSHRGITATVRDPFGNVLPLIEPAADADTAAPPHELQPGDIPGLFGPLPTLTEVKPELLIHLYTQAGRTADDLPYTHHFELIYDAYASTYEKRPERREVWLHLLRLRKAGKLPQLGKGRSRPPDVPEADRAVLRDMLGDALGRRDRLPYTPELEALRVGFESRCGHRLSPHQFWRLVALIAK